jgi:hypothetical protein
MGTFFIDCVMVECNAAFDHEHFTIADCCAQDQELWGRERERRRGAVLVMMKMPHLLGSSAAAAAAA